MLLVDKATGMTSYDVIRRLKKIFPQQKIGHSGTLDPLATGLMLVGVGKDTKQLSVLQGLDKSYEVIVSFALETDTWDSDYRDVIREYPLSAHDDGSIGIVKDGFFCQAPTEDQLLTIMNGLIPSAILPLPSFSAKKKNGHKLYDLARKGTFVQEYREMFLSDYTVISYDFPFLTLSVSVGSGFYVRSLAHWLGQYLGLGGCVVSLRRTRIGDYHVEDAHTLEDLST